MHVVRWELRSWKAQWYGFGYEFPHSRIQMLSSDDAIKINQKPISFIAYVDTRLPEKKMTYLLLSCELRNLVNKPHRCLVIFECEAFSNMWTTDVSSE